jgi:hypothetical protein
VASSSVVSTRIVDLAVELEHADACAAEAFDGLAIEVFRGWAGGEQRSRTSLDREAPVVSTGLGHLRQLRDGIGGRLGIPRPGRCLDELRESPEGVLGLGSDGARNSVLRLLVAAETVVEHSTRPLNRAHRDPFTSSNDLLLRGLDELGDFPFPAPPRGERQGAVEGEPTAGRVGERLRLLDLGSDLGELAGEQEHAVQGA